MGLTLKKQIEYISKCKDEIHETTRNMVSIIQEAYNRMKTQDRNFQLSDDEILAISNGVGKINTNLSIMAGFADRNTKIIILNIMEVGGKAYLLLRTPTRLEAIGMLDAWLLIVQSIIPDFTKTPLKFRISAEVNSVIGKIRGLFERT